MSRISISSLPQNATQFSGQHRSFILDKNFQASKSSHISRFSLASSTATTLKILAQRFNLYLTAAHFISKSQAIIMRKSLLSAACRTPFRSTRPASISTLTSRVRSIQPQRSIIIPALSQRLPLSHSIRAYSTEKASSDAAENQSEEQPVAESAEDAGKKELEAAKKEIIDLKDKYLRSVADFRNLQDRTKRDINSARDFAISKFARDLLDSVDNLDRALSTVPEAVVKASGIDGGNGAEVEINKDLQNLYDGLKMTERVLLSTLSKHGLERFDPAEKSDRFDPNIHDASFMAPMPDKEDGSVFTTVQKGFTLNGRVVRAAKVGVVKNS